MATTRRQFLKATFAAATAAAITGCQDNLVAGPEAITGKPNILFIIADDLGWADVGYHGSTFKTPNIDRLAESGVTFDRFYVMPTCTPTRVGLMTGQYPSRYGVTSPAYGNIFGDDTVTIANAMADSGYETFISGKWHMGSPPEYTPLKYGFEHSYGYFAGQIDPYTHLYKTGIKSWHRDDGYLEEEGHATDLITDEAIRIIEAGRKKPFFLYVAYSVPHFPLDEPEEWLSMYPDIAEDSRRWYAASVTHMDHGIGQIIDALDRSGKRSDTLVVFVSDNGGQQSWHSDTEYKGRYAQKPHTVLGDNLPLRGYKGSLHEGGIRVPGLANFPGVLKKGKCTAPMHIVDWMPTLCRIAGHRPTKSLSYDGVDVWPAITGRENDLENRTMYWKTPGQWAARKGPLKLITNKKSEKVELYDVVADPLEKTNLAPTRPEAVAQLTQLLDQFKANDR